MTSGRGSFWSLLFFGTIVLTFACQETPTDSLSVRELEPACNPGELCGSTPPSIEEEILGGVFRNGSPLSSSEARLYSVRITPVVGCVKRAQGPCLTPEDPDYLESAEMPVIPTGSVPGNSTNNHWGWYNDVDTESGENVCMAGLDELHDLDGDGSPDSHLGLERHCVSPGIYRIQLLNEGQPLFSRTVDHVRVAGNMGARNIEDPNGSSVQDVWVRFELSESVPVSVGRLKLRGDASSGFVNGDITVPTGTEVQFLSTASTAWGPTGGSNLLYRVLFDKLENPNLQTNLANPELLIRHREYSEPDDYVVEARVVSPSDAGTAGQAAPAHTVTVVATTQPVTSIEVSPSSATIDVGQSIQLTATLRDADGNQLTGRSVSWSTSNSSVASISGSGETATVTGQVAGTTTITATSEGVAGHATITVQESTVDDAASLGNTFPSSMSAGGIASVTLTMRNSGTSTWTAGYRLSLVRQLGIWMPDLRFLSANVPPGADQVFAFDLRHVEPEVTGTVAAFYRMRTDAFAGVLFGDENGRDIFVSGTKTLSATTEPALTTSLDPSTTAGWMAGAEEGGASELPIPASALAGGKIALLEYTYSHAVPRELDVVLRFTYDPDVLTPLPSRPGPGAAGLARTAGLTALGEYWIRLTGTVSSGEGRIVTFPFRLKGGATPPETLGTLRMYYPDR